MDKERIKQKVIGAYQQARQYPDFLPKFKANVQDVIDSLVPPETTHSAHVYHDIDYLSQVSKREGHSAAGYVRLIANYVAMIVKAVEEGKKEIDITAQPDLFDEDDFEANK